MACGMSVPEAPSRWKLVRDVPEVGLARLRPRKLGLSHLFFSFIPLSFLYTLSKM